MSLSLVLSGYELTDEGPGRTVNEDAVLVRHDLGLFALADGAGGRGKGDVASTLALRTIENYVGSTVRRSHGRPDFDALGLPEQARRLSAAIHRAHQNVIQVATQDPQRQGMASTVVAALFAPRTNQLHVAHVGDSRCYRMRHGRLELLTVDDTIATEILQTRPETTDEVLERLPRNSVVRAVGMADGFRVAVTTHDLVPGDRFLLCSDGLTSCVSTIDLWEAMRDPDPPSVVASELLSLALAARGQDNISVLVLECEELQIDEAVETRRYNEFAGLPPSAPLLAVSDQRNSSEFVSPDVVSSSFFEAVEDFRSDSDAPTHALPQKELSGTFEAGLIGELPRTLAFEKDEDEEEDEDEDEVGKSAGDGPGPSRALGVSEPEAFDIDVADIEFDSERSVDLGGLLASSPRVGDAEAVPELVDELDEEDTSQVRQAPPELSEE